MNNEFLKKVYQKLKDKFKYIDEKSGIYLYFFKSDEKFGYEFFVESFCMDKDYDYLKDESYFIGKDIDEIVSNVSDDIEYKMLAAYAIEEFQQKIHESSNNL